MGMKKPGARPQPVVSDPARAFIEAAPNQELDPELGAVVRAPEPVRNRGGRPKKAPEELMERVTLLLPPEMLAEVDAAAKRAELPRLMWIRRAIRAALKAGME